MFIEGNKNSHLSTKSDAVELSKRVLGTLQCLQDQGEHNPGRDQVQTSIYCFSHQPVTDRFFALL